MTKKLVGVTVAENGDITTGPAVKKLAPVSPKGVKDINGIYVKPEAPKPPKPFALEDFLFDKQLKFVQDPHDFKVAVCSRRSGKSVSCAADLIDTALKNDGVVCLYVTLSRNNAKKLVWKELLSINRDYALGATPDTTELSLTFPNKSMIYCSGAKDASEIEKFRGLAIKLCYIDECQSFRPYIEELINDVISPALMDYAGRLCLIGTPGPVPAGFFYECAEKSSVWVRYGWTFFDNPFIASKSKKTHQQLLERELKRRGVTVDDPSIQREFFGRWVLDSDSLILHYSRDKNHFSAIPDNKNWHYILGIDLGFVDADALAVVAWCDDSPRCYLVEEIVADKQGLTELVGHVQALQAKYDISKMVIDEGGLGKKIAEEMRRRYHIPVQPADKTRKMENIAFLNDSLRTGMFMAKEDSRFAQDTYLVEIDRLKSTPDRIKVSDSYHSDIIDAVLYAFKESPAFTYRAPEKKPVKGSKEWADAEEDRMFEEAREHFEQAAETQRRIENFGFDPDGYKED